MFGEDMDKILRIRPLLFGPPHLLLLLLLLLSVLLYSALSLQIPIMRSMRCVSTYIANRKHLSDRLK